MGFAGSGVTVDDLTIRSDSDKDGVLEATDTVETVETFTVTDGAAAETPACDAAGNLTYDGLHAYTYDAWNRLVTVRRAYPDGSAGHTEGSTIATLTYDGLGRRSAKVFAA